MDEEYIELLREVLPEDWDIDSEVYGMDAMLIAPCGNTVEVDGICCCPEHHISPLRGLGLV